MPTDSTQLLALRDIHTPAAVSWWPLSAASWLMILVFLLLIAMAVWWLLRRRNDKQFGRAALNSLSSLERVYVEHGNLQQFLYDLSVYLRRLLLNKRPTSEFSNLRSEQWCDYLNSIIYHSGNRNPIYFSHADFRLIDHAIYRKTIDHPQFDVIRFRQSVMQLIAALSIRRQGKKVRVGGND